MNVKKIEPTLNIVSLRFMPILIRFAKKTDRILEFGSSTGHMSFILAKDGYNISLLDIRKDPICEAIETFSHYNIKALFYNEDFLSHNNEYEFIFNSGLLQCFIDSDREKFIKHSSRISKKLLLFYPLRDKIIPQKDLSKINGVEGCEEYPTSSIYKIVSHHFNNMERGIISNVYNSDCAFEWIFGY
jgi:hypothetical protein